RPAGAGGPARPGGAPARPGGAGAASAAGAGLPAGGGGEAPGEPALRGAEEAGGGAAGPGAGGGAGGPSGRGHRPLDRGTRRGAGVEQYRAALGVYGVLERDAWQQGLAEAPLKAEQVAEVKARVAGLLGELALTVYLNARADEAGQAAVRQALTYLNHLERLE